MRLRNRFLLIGFGIVLFTITTPIIVLYARGFKYDFATGQIVKTGILVVKTEPEKAVVFIDDEKLEKETPVNVRFLTPKDYNIRIEKEGYQTWSKRLPVHPQFVTWTNHNREFTTLFLSAPKLKEIFTEKSERFPASTQEASIDDRIRNLILQKITDPANVQIIKEENKVFAVIDQALYVVNDSLELIYTPVTYTRWDRTTSQMLFGNANEIQIYNPNNKNSELILRSLTPVSKAILNVQSGYIFYMNDNAIKAVELDGRDHRNIYTVIGNLEQAAEFEISADGKELYLWDSAGGKVFTIR